MRAGETLGEGVSLDSCRHAHATAVEALMCKWMSSLTPRLRRSIPVTWPRIFVVSY